MGAAETGACRAAPAGKAGDADPIRFRLLGGWKPAGWLELRSARSSRVRVPGGAALNCWGGGAAETASSEKADGSLVAKVNLFYNGRMG